MLPGILYCCYNAQQTSMQMSTVGVDKAYYSSLSVLKRMEVYGSQSQITGKQRIHWSLSANTNMFTTMLVKTHQEHFSSVYVCVLYSFPEVTPFLLFLAVLCGLV